MVIVSAVLVLIAPLFANPALNAPVLLWLGLGTEEPPSDDYNPLFPWFAFLLIGIAIARLIAPYVTHAVWARWSPRDPAAQDAGAGGPPQFADLPPAPADPDGRDARNIAAGRGIVEFICNDAFSLREPVPTSLETRWPFSRRPTPPILRGYAESPDTPKKPKDYALQTRAKKMGRGASANRRAIQPFLVERVSPSHAIVSTSRRWLSGR